MQTAKPMVTVTHFDIFLENPSFFSFFFRNIVYSVLHEETTLVHSDNHTKRNALSHTEVISVINSAASSCQASEDWRSWGIEDQFSPRKNNLDKDHQCSDS